MNTVRPPRICIELPTGATDMPLGLNPAIWIVAAREGFANRLTDALVGILAIALILLLYTEMTRGK